MPPNADPHDFAASAQQAASMRDADALVVNGLGFEEGLLDTIEAAEADGVPVIEATDAIEPLPLGDGDDPHLFTDPVRMQQAATFIAAELADAVPALDTAAVQERQVAAYAADLDALDAEVEELLAVVPAEDRLLVTNHEVFGYFADRYDFEVIGAIIPGGSTLAEPSAPSWPSSSTTSTPTASPPSSPRPRRRRGWPTRWPPRAPTWRWWSSTASPSASRARPATATSGWFAPTPSGSRRPWDDLLRWRDGALARSTPSIRSSCSEPCSPGCSPSSPRPSSAPGSCSAASASSATPWPTG